MVKEYSSFSPCGKNFVYCGPDGKLRIWDCFSGILKQEFVPDLHLHQPSTSLLWLSLSKSRASPWKSKKRKSSVRALGLGTNNGTISLYSLAEGKVICTLQGGHSSSVSCLSWSDKHGLFSVSDNVVVIWDLKEKAIKSKWKCGKGKITSIAVCDESDICVTCSFNLKIWNVNTHELVKSLTGHSSEVTHVRFLSNQNLMSMSAGDRHISVWSPLEDRDEPVVRFALGDSVRGGVSVREEDGLVRVAAVCSSGVFHFFSYQFNGKTVKSVKPAYSVQIGSDRADPEVNILPIMAAHLSSPHSAIISYGLPPVFTFETIELRNTKESVCLVRTPKAKQLLNNISKVGEEVGEDVEYVSETRGGLKRRGQDGSGEGEVPLEERLNNLSQESKAAVGGGAEATPQSMAELLCQGLESRDRAVLETTLFTRDLGTVRQTVAKLPLRFVPLLVRELAAMIHGKTLTSSVGVVWLKSVLSVHASQLLADEPTLELLSSVHGLVETRLSSLVRLHRLSGRLELLLQQVQGQSASCLESSQQALLVFNDEDSLDEGSSCNGDGAEPSESEDKWDELSDQMDTEDANMSS